MNTLLSEQNKRLPQMIFLAVILTSVASLLLGVVNGVNMVNWLGEWLLDFSTDLAGGGALFLVIRWLMSDQRKPEKTSLETTFIDATELPMQDEERESIKLERLADALQSLRDADTPEARQHIIDRLMRRGTLLREVNLMNFDLFRANFRGADLLGANLTNAKLRSADLRRANLQNATLTSAQLIEANLSGADLSGALLDHCYMSGADLSNTRMIGARISCSLWGVHLQGADLQDANLSGAELFRTNLTGANLAGVVLLDAKINKETILPDGIAWNNRVDISRFTNAEHAQFWRSDDPASPAYSGDG
jgi:uncharacterized protein YjbI with pentapeptide repeats